MTLELLRPVRSQVVNRLAVLLSNGMPPISLLRRSKAALYPPRLIARAL